ncbi:unnamed protein product [Auanema sp. JU1783]|nr:unnamed protein product [Auanema sp. JU1783]
METSDPILRRLPVHMRAGAVLLGGLFSMLSFGTVYTFGNMLPYMVSYLRWKVDPTMKAGSMIWLQTLLSGVPFAMIAGGVLERRMGGKRAAILGSLMYTGGTAMTFITIQKSYGLMLISMGLVASFGGSIAYNAILTTAQKWFPQNVGMASGIIVGGYGCGAFILSPLQTSYINPLDYRVNAEGYFTQEDLLERVPYVFLVMATVYFLLQTVGLTFVGAPKEDHDEGDQLISENHSQPISTQLKSMTFVVLFISLTLNSLWVQIVSGLYKAYGQQFIYSDMFLSFVGSLSSIANAGSRIVWGLIVDKSSYQTCMCIVTSLAACSIWLLPTIKWIGNDMVFLISICTMFTCVGGTYSLFPYITNRCFGRANFGVVYGTLQTALCVAGIFAGFLCQFLLPEIGFENLFIIAGFCMAASFALTVVLHRTDMAESSSQYSLVSTEE